MMAEHQNPEEVANGARSRKTTEKGALYQLSIKQKAYKRALSAVRSTGRKLIDVLSGNEEIQCVKAELENWLKLCQDLTSSDQEVRTLLPAEDVDYHVSRHSSQLEDNDAIKAKVMKFLTGVKPEEVSTDGVEPHDSASNLFMTTRTALSGFSQRSSGGASSVSSARLKEKQNKQSWQQEQPS